MKLQRVRLDDLLSYLYSAWQRCCRSVVSIAIITCVAFVAHPALAQNYGPLSISSTTWSVNSPNNVGGGGSLIGGGCTTGDVTGNSVTDIVCINTSGGGQRETNTPTSAILLKSTQNSSSGFLATLALGAKTSTDLSYYGARCAVADFDGDGRSDLACFAVSNEFYEGYPTAWFSNGTDFQSAPVVNSSAAYTIPPATNVGNGGQTIFSEEKVQPFGTSCTVGHFMEGAGQQILCNFPNQGYASAKIQPTTNYYIYRYIGSGYSATNPTGPGSVQEPVPSQWTGPPHILTWGGYANFGSNCLTGDFNGSGLTDVACPDGKGNWNMGISTGTGFAEQVWPTSDGVFHKDCTTGDFNGDGKTDIACYVDGAANPIQIYLSTGSGFQTMQSWTFTGTSITGAAFTNQSWSGAGMPPPQNADNSNTSTGEVVVNGQTYRDTSIFATVCSTADLNGDGKTDIICYSNNSTYSSDFVYALSTGSGFTVGHLKFITPPVEPLGLSGLTSGNSAPFEYACILADFMGKGLPDIICPSTSSPPSYNVGIISRN